MTPTMARVGRALLAADRGAWSEVLTELDGVQGVPWSLDGPVCRALIQALTHTGALEAAEHIANQRLQRAPEDVDTRTARARIWMRAGLLPEARADLDTVLKRSPRHPAATLAIGEIALAQGNLAEASVHLQAACAAAPFSAEPAVALARLFSLAGRPGDGARQLDALHDAGPLTGHPALLASLVELHLAAGHTDAARERLVQLEQLTGPRTTARIELVRLWAELAHRPDLVARTTSPDPATASLASAALAELDHTDPLPALDAALPHTQAHWWVHERRALALLRSGQLDAATEAIDQARKRAPRAAAVRVTAARVALRRGPSRSARRLLEVAATHEGLWPSVRASAAEALAE